MSDGAKTNYIIIGAGSAGCVLADRLSASGRHRVLLLEAGGDDRPFREKAQLLSNMMIQIPAGYSRTLDDPAVNWMYETEADPGTGNRKHAWPRGKVFGGSSAINGMLYIRGQRADYDAWRQLGCAGWSWDDVAPYFRRSERREMGGDYGTGGPLHVSRPTSHAVSDAVLEACAALGLPHRDVNDGDQEGADLFQLTVKNGRRWSTARAYLHPALKRSNLRVEKHALVTRVIIDDGCAVGVEFLQHGERRTARAAREVLLAGGSVNSPQLLQLSGIGPADLLRDHGIEPLVDAPEVGGNLQDHYVVPEAFRLKPGTVSFNELSRGAKLAGEVVKYLWRRKGLLSLSAAHVAVFCKSRPDLASPDIQFHIVPATGHVQTLLDKRPLTLEREPGLTVAPCQLRPESRGTIRIRSSDPRIHPRIRPNYLADRVDQEAIVAGLRWGRRIAGQAALRRHVAHETIPGDGVQTDDELLAFARQSGTTIYHPVGTCAMGDQPGAVVDPRLRVRGVARLRVIDASIMPRLISGNTNAATIMIAEKGADMVLEAAETARL